MADGWPRAMASGPESSFIAQSPSRACRHAPGRRLPTAPVVAAIISMLALMVPAVVVMAPRAMVMLPRVVPVTMFTMAPPTVPVVTPVMPGAVIVPAALAGQAVSEVAFPPIDLRPGFAA